LAPLKKYRTSTAQRLEEKPQLLGTIGIEVGLQRKGQPN
jgi:hypothetical protein